MLDPSVEPGPAKLLGLVLALIQGIALWWRRAQPERVMAIALVGGLGIQLIAPDGLLPWAGLFALGSLAALRPPRVSLPALAALLALTATNLFTAKNEDTAFAIVVVLGAWAFGEVVRSRRATIAEAVRRAASEEQARIARELHDVIAHSVSVIVVQAAAAAEVFDAQPEQARAALRSIETAGRDALRELRLLLAVDRRGVDAASADPQPGLDRLDELVEPLRAAGLDVAVRWDGPERALPAGVDLSAFRIVQEALTNTLRHAHASHAEVTVRVASDVLELTSSTTAAASPASRATEPDAAWRACASGRRCTAARSRRAPPAAGATAFTRACRWRRRREHSRAARGRPGAGARRLPDDPGGEGRPRGGGRSRRRRARRPSWRSSTGPTSS